MLRSQPRLALPPAVATAIGAGLAILTTVALAHASVPFWEIGRVKITIADPDKPFGTHAFIVLDNAGAANTAADSGDGRPRWVAIGIPGHMDEAKRALDPQDAARVRITRVPRQAPSVVDVRSAPAAPTARRQGKGRGDRAWPEAEHCFLQALEVARASQSKSLELRAATSLARAWLARDRGADAQDLLEPLCRWFGTAAGADLDAARALLAKMPSDSSRSRFA